METIQLLSQPKKPKKIEKFLLEAIGGFVFWTAALTPYMVFIVKTNFMQYIKWVGMELLIIPLLAPFSIMFMSWVVKLGLKAVVKDYKALYETAEQERTTTANSLRQKGTECAGWKRRFENLAKKCKKAGIII